MTGIINFLVFILTFMGIYSLLTLGLNFTYGFTGLINFGHVGFFAVGAYTSALLLLNGVPFILSLILGALSAALVGMVFSLPTAKLGVHYWAIITLGAAEIIRLFIMTEEWLTRGTFGLINIPRPLDDVIPKGYYPHFYLFLTVIIVALTLFAIERLVNSPFGRILRAVRDGDELPLAFGKKVHYYKVISMSIGAGIAGMAGVLYASFTTYISPWDFMPAVTFLVWTMTIIGGKGNNYGSIVGSVIVMSIYSSTRFIKDYVPIPAPDLASLRIVAIGIIFLLVLIYRREGLIPEKGRKLAHAYS